MKFIDLQRQYQKYKADIDARMQAVIDNTRFINGTEVTELEQVLAEYCGARYAIGVSSGTDALLVGLAAYGIGKGDEVITTPFTFAATVEAIVFLGATPVFVDIDENDYNLAIDLIEEKITKRTKCILPVSLYGQIPDIDRIMEIAYKHNLFVMEDAAQSFGAIYKGRKSCSIANISITSFYPSKPLGCYGDGGMVFTNDEHIAQQVRMIANHGAIQTYVHQRLGINARLDTLQAAVLLAKFAHFEDECNMRHNLGLLYNQLLKNAPVVTPALSPFTDRHVFAQYSIQVNNRDRFRESLDSKGIPTAVHYARPLHLQEAYRYLGYKRGDFPISERIADKIVSLPFHPFLREEEVREICDVVRESAE